jgi:hypothetical protein
VMIRDTQNMNVPILQTESNVCDGKLFGKESP